MYPPAATPRFLPSNVSAGLPCTVPALLIITWPAELAIVPVGPVGPVGPMGPVDPNKAGGAEIKRIWLTVCWVCVVGTTQVSSHGAALPCAGFGLAYAYRT